MSDEIPGQARSMPDAARQDHADRAYQSARRKSRTVRKTDENVADILDRRNESRRYDQINYWDAWEEVYRASKCRTKPIMVKDRTGVETEDKTRTNVAMPELSLIARRKTARLTANPPQINYTVPQDQSSDLADRLTAWAYQQFDRSGEAQEHRKMVQGANIFGWAASKLYWDTVEVTRKFFRAVISDGKPYGLDRQGLMSAQGAPDDEIADAVKQMGAQLSNKEIGDAIARFGNTVQVPQKVTRFEGPVSKNVFIGDFFLEPGCASLNTSGWAIENYWETDRFLQKMLAKTYIDPQTGDEMPVFDQKKVAELEDMPSWQPIYMQQPFDLRARLRTNALGQTLPLWPTKLLKGKRYDILECHTADSDGQFWIEWVGNEKVALGKMPYPWDLYGKYMYTEFVPMFDLLSCRGDSTPILLRHLWLLHNAIVGSRRDLVANLLRPLMKLRIGADIPDEQVDRVLFRVIQMRNLDDLQPVIENISSIAAAIQGATEEEAQNMRMMALAEPNLTNVETGTESNPQAGKTATTAVLAAKSADALTQFEIDGLNYYLKESGEKKLAMLQQTEPETDSDGSYKPYQIGAEYSSKVEGLSQRYGKTSLANLDFMEIQQEITVEPAAMSMLSVDDEIHRNGALQLVEMAGQMPTVVDPYYAARNFASTIKGVDPDKAILKPQPPAPPQPKASLTISAKLPELTPQERMTVMGAAGVPATAEQASELNLDHTLKGIEKMSDAADHAHNLMSTGDEGEIQEPDTNLSRGVGNPSPVGASR